MSMTPEELKKYINNLIDKNEVWRFYKTRDWIELKQEVLEEQHHECQICKEKGIITITNTVHHVQYVRNHPEYALSKYYTYDGKTYKNLIAVCPSCHNKLHKEKGHKPKSQLNKERW